jgi:hypothetical protein
LRRLINWDDDEQRADQRPIDQLVPEEHEFWRAEFDAMTARGIARRELLPVATAV